MESRRIAHGVKLTEARGLPWLVLVFSLAVTLSVWLLIDKDIREKGWIRFYDRTETIEDQIQSRMNDYEQILRGAAGLWAAGKEVSRTQWRAYTNALQVDQHYPGVQGIGYIRRIQAAETAGHLQRVAEEGLPGYRIWPEGERAEHYPIAFLEPSSGPNLRALGFDIFSEPVRRKAAELARDTGTAILTGKIMLVQEISPADRQNGLLMLLPVYADAGPHDTVARRRDALLGFVYSPFRMNDLMRGIFGRSFKGIGMVLSDGTAPGTDPVIFDSSAQQGGEKVPEDYHSLLSRTDRFDLYGRTWTASFRSLPTFNLERERDKPRIVLLSGLMISFLLFSATLMLALRNRALLAAQGMTEALKGSEERFRMLTQSAGDAIISADAAGNIATWNKAAERLFGYPPEDILGRSIEVLIPDRYKEAHRQGMQRAASIGLSGLSGRTMQFSGLRRDGSEFPLELSVSAWEVDGKPFWGAIIRNVSERLKAEEELRLQEAYFEQLFENSPEGIAILDKTGAILDANRGFQNLFHFSREEISGRPLNDLILPGHLSGESKALFARLLNRETVHTETVRKRKDGSPVHVSILGAPITLDKDQIGVYAIYRDISDRMRMEESLARERANLQAMFDAVSTSLILLDGNGVVKRVNAVAANWVGQDLTSDRDLQPGDFLRCVNAIASPAGCGSTPHCASCRIRGAFQSALQTGNSVRNVETMAELSIRGADTRLWVIVSADPVVIDGERHVILALNDITDRQRAEEALHASEIRYRGLFETAKDGILLLEGDSGKVTDVNPFLVDLLGCARYDLLGRTLEEIDAFASSAKDRVSFDELRARRYVRYESLPLKAKDEREVEVEFISTVYSVVGKDVIQCNVRDITERKKNEKMKDEFISVVSHELRTPVASILGALRLVLGGATGELGEQTRALLEMACRNSDVLVLLINDILDIHKIESGKMSFHVEPQRLRPLIERAAELSRPYAEQFKVRFSPDPLLADATVRVDGERLIQVYMNLLSNAAKYSVPQDEVNLAVLRKDGFVRTTVTDHGPGIPDHFRNHVFEKFAQADSTDSRRRGGTGLGLSICKAIVEKMGGRIGFESATGRGTTFFVDLPESS